MCVCVNEFVWMCVHHDHTCVHTNPTNPTQPNQPASGHVLTGMVFWQEMHTPHTTQTLAVEVQRCCLEFRLRRVGQMVRDVYHDVTEHQHLNVTINRPVPDSPSSVWTRSHLHRHIHTSADRLSLNPHQTCCPTFDFHAVVEVDVLEFGFVLEGVQAA